MSYLLDGVAILLLGLIVFQDFKHRLISWFLIPSLLIISLMRSVQLNGINDALYYFFINSVFVLIQLLSIMIYFSIKNKKWVNIINQYIGIGDVLFFVVLCAVFSPANFIVFYLLSLLLTIIGYLAYRFFYKEANKEIPLAGTMALGLIICMVCQYFFHAFQFYTDQWIVPFL